MKWPVSRADLNWRNPSVFWALISSLISIMWIWITVQQGVKTRTTTDTKPVEPDTGVR